MNFEEKVAGTLMRGSRGQMPAAGERATCCPAPQ